MTGYCEDYPCCGHTPQDPCTRQWYDEPGAFDTSRNPHALCEHEYGFCDVFEYDDDEDEPDEPAGEECDDYDQWAPVPPSHTDDPPAHAGGLLSRRET